MFESLLGEELQVNYKPIMESYHRVKNEFDQIYTLTAALEAEANPLDQNPGPDATKSADEATPTQKNKTKIDLGGIMGKILEKFRAIITRFIEELKNRWNKILLTDKGFKKELRDAEVNRKPLKAIKVITWEYNTKALDNAYLAYQTAANELINKFNLKEVFANPDHPFTAGSNEEFEQRLFRIAKLPDEVTNADQMTLYMKKIFHQHKKEQTFFEKDVPLYIKNSSNYEAMKAVVNNSTSSIQAKSNAIINMIKNETLKTEIPEENRKRINNIINRMIQLYNQYTTISSFYFELKTEYMINCRLIVRRFYQI